MQSQFIADLKLPWNEFFSVSTLNNKGGVLCSARVSEQLKMRKSLAIHYELNKSLININKLWGVSISSVICYYFLL